MARTPGTARLSGTIEPLAGGALDAREVVQTKADLTASGSFPYPYIGMETYVVAENKKYRLVGEDPTDIDNWQEAIPEVDVDNELSTISENPVQNKVIKGAIDDVTDSIGDLADLDTTEKGSIVGAINEVKDFDNLNNRPTKDVTSMSDIITPIPSPTPIPARDYTMFGFRLRANQSDPEMVEYLGDAVGMTPAHMDFATDTFDYGSWEDAPFMPKMCMVTYGGETDYYLNNDDFTKREDGVTASDVANTSYAGNAMREWAWRNGNTLKPIWYKITPLNNGESACIYIADKQVDDDFHCWSFINNQGEQVNRFYDAIYNGSLINSKLRSLSGRQVSNNYTRQQEVTYAKANNTSSAVLWYTETYADWTLINLLHYLIGGSLNTQAQFGMGLCDSGTEAINNAFRTGVHNTKGLFYGTSSGTASTYTNAVKTFGRENWWGFQWRGLAGWINANGTQKVKLTYDTQDGSTASAYNFDGTNYITISNATPTGTSGGYINRVKYTKKGVLVPYQASGSESTYYCDGLWFNNSQVDYARVGGDSGDGSHVGAGCSALNALSSGVSWAIGAVLSCKPQA